MDHLKVPVGAKASARSAARRFDSRKTGVRPRSLTHVVIFEMPGPEAGNLAISFRRSQSFHEMPHRSAPLRLAAERTRQRPAEETTYRIAEVQSKTTSTESVRSSWLSVVQRALDQKISRLTRFLYHIV